MITYYWQPFIATGDYVGPDRKGDTPMHPGARRVDVINTLLKKSNGRKFEQWELKEAIDESVNKVVEAQLTSHSMKMGAICDLILEACKSNLVTEDLRDNLSELTGIIHEAGNMAKRIKDTSLESLCLTLVDNVATMESNYESLTDADINLIEKLSEAFRMAIDSAAQRKQDEEDAIAARYEGRISE